MFHFSHLHSYSIRQMCAHKSDPTGQIGGMCGFPTALSVCLLPGIDLSHLLQVIRYNKALSVAVI
jgi:hypothetical protein